MKQLFIFIASITRTSFQKSYISNSFLERAILKVILQILHCINSKCTLKEIICWVPHNHTLVCKPPPPAPQSRGPHTFGCRCKIVSSGCSQPNSSVVSGASSSTAVHSTVSPAFLSMNFVYHRTL